MTETLKPCPFTRIVVDKTEDGWRLHDFPEDSEIALFIADEIETEAEARFIADAVNQAIAAWNRRPAEHGEPVAVVREVETVTGDFLTDRGESFYRIELGGYCADFDYREAAENFAAQINSRIAPPQTEPATDDVDTACNAFCDVFSHGNAPTVDDMPDPEIYRNAMRAALSALQAKRDEK